MIEDDEYFTYSAVYVRPNGKIDADWIRSNTIRGALLGAENNIYVGKRIGYLKRPFEGPPEAVGFDARFMTIGNVTCEYEWHKRKLKE